MHRILRTWYDLSIKAKCILLMGLTMAIMWSLVGMVSSQLQNYNHSSSIIMNEYRDITGFMDAFSAENVCLETYMRPRSGNDEYQAYIDAISKTNRQLNDLQINREVDSRSEQALKRAIHSAMEYYRESQTGLLNPNEDIQISLYLSLKSQAAYIDGYTRDLLHNRIAQGGVQWSEIEASTNRRTQEFIVFMLLATALLVLVVLVFARSILTPLERLSEAADEISSGNYDAPPLKERGQDELGRTAHSFNLMQTEVRQTIDAMEKQAEMERQLLEREVEHAQMQRSLQEGRFAQLQSQINPHFLFNTLNTITALAAEERAHLTEGMIHRLSSFFRYSLESDEKVVTLGRELQLLQDYMELQEMRYGERIAMRVISDPTLENVKVPKFILQPLVENSILHGLHGCAAGGEIRVRSCRTRHGVTVFVTDNGQGFDTKHPPQRENHKAVGLENIRERMQYYGGQLDVFSIPGVGTTNRITIREEMPHD